MGEQSLSDELLAGGLAAGLGALIPGAGLAQPAVQRLVTKVRREHARNTSMAWEAAEAASGLSREDLVVFVEENPRGVPMYLLILHAAGMNGYEQTLRAMGAVFGSAAESALAADTSAVERADAALRAMADLTPHHFRTLRHVVEHPPVQGSNGSKNFSGTTHEAVAAALAIPADDAAQYLLNLAGAGLVTMATGLFGGGAGYEATLIGAAVAEAAGWIAHP